MAKVYEFLANGFEEVEALAPVDILRRGGVEVKTVSITGSPLVESSHGVMVKADLQIEDLGVIDDADMLLIPGGMPGAQNLKDDVRVGKHCFIRWRVVNVWAQSVLDRWFSVLWESSRASVLHAIQALRSFLLVQNTPRNYALSMAM